MKKLVSFDKSLEFKSMIGEVSAISLDHDLKFVDGSNIKGEFLVSGKYKLTEASRLEEEFSFKIPVEIILSEVLELDTAKVDIEDFNYRVIDDDTLLCHIDVKVEGVEEVIISDDDNKIELLEEELSRECDGDMNKNDIEEFSEKEIEEETGDMEEKPVDVSINNNDMGSLFSALSDDESYATYSVYIMREDDTLEKIMNKYKVSREDLENYNDLGKLDIGSKVIIPSTNEEN